MEAVVAIRQRPSWQNREGLPTGRAPAAAKPDTIMALVVRLLAPAAVTDDGVVAARRTAARQELEGKRSHPGSMLFPPSGNAIKRIKAGVKSRAERRPARFDLVAGLHPPVKSASIEEKNIAFAFRTLSYPTALAGIKA